MNGVSGATPHPRRTLVVISAGLSQPSSTRLLADRLTAAVQARAEGETEVQVIELRDRSEKNVAFFWTASRGDKGPLAKLKAASIPIFYTPAKLAGGLKQPLCVKRARTSWPTV